MSRRPFNRTVAVSLAFTVLVVAALVVGNLIISAQATIKPIIVELKSDPVVVAKSAAAARGQQFDEAAYRQQFIAEQEQFLNQLSASGIQFNVVSVDAPNGLNGETANIVFRFNYVYNGITLTVAEDANSTEFGAISANQLRLNRSGPLNKPVDFTIRSK